MRREWEKREEKDRNEQPRTAGTRTKERGKIARCTAVPQRERGRVRDAAEMYASKLVGSLYIYIIRKSTSVSKNKQIKIIVCVLLLRWYAVKGDE